MWTTGHKICVDIRIFLTVRRGRAVAASRRSAGTSTGLWPHTGRVVELRPSTLCHSRVADEIARMQLAVTVARR